MSSSFGERALWSVDPARLEIHQPPSATPGGASLRELCREALAHPVASPSLAELSQGAARIVIVISDATRDEPRQEMLDALLERLPSCGVSLMVASGTHEAGYHVPDRLRHLPIRSNPCWDPSEFADLGRTARGTRVRLVRELCDADLVVVTGRVRPHYFAGYSAGVKGVFPGCAFGEDILQNHLLKAEPGARLGRLDDNPCRLDMEEAAQLMPARLVALNVLCDCDGQPVAAAFGHAVRAHRQLCRQAAPLFGVRARRSPVVVVADRPPATRSLYQASKLLPPAGAVLEPGGTLILVAECDQGIEPRERVNQGIYRLGVARSLPQEHRIVLVSELPEAIVADSYAEPAPSLEAALNDALLRHGTQRAVCLWRASESIASSA